MVWLCCVVAWDAHAEIYKHVDASGVVVYTDYPVKGAKRLGIMDYSGHQDTGTHKSVSGITGKAINIPHIDAATQGKRDNLRHDVLEGELQTEMQSLADATQARKQAAPHAGEQINSPAYLQRLSKLDEAVKLHQDNITALDKELARIK